MVVAQTFQNANFAVIQGEYYQDFETQQYREIDITATTYSTEFEKPTVLEICCCIECRYSKEKPWIIFSANNNIFDIFPMQLLASEMGQKLMWGMTSTADVWSTLGLSRLLQSIQGYGLTQAFTSGQDIAFQAVMSAYKAAVARIINSNNNRWMEPKETLISISIPIVIIDGRIFKCELDGDGNMNVIEVNVGIMRWRRENPVNTSSPVIIGTKIAIDEVIEYIKDLQQSLINTITNLYQNGHTLLEAQK